MINGGGKTFLTWIIYSRDADPHLYTGMNFLFNCHISLRTLLLDTLVSTFCSAIGPILLVFGQVLSGSSAAAVFRHWRVFHLVLDP